MRTKKTIFLIAAALVVALGSLSAQAGGWGRGGNNWGGGYGGGYGGGCQGWNCGGPGGPYSPPNGPPSGGGYGGGHGGWGGNNGGGWYNPDRPRGNWQTRNGYYHEYRPGRYVPMYDPWAPQGPVQPRYQNGIRYNPHMGLCGTWPATGLHNCGDLR